jgi:hypothetical protein
MLSQFAVLAVALAFLEEPVAFGQGHYKGGRAILEKENAPVYDLDAVFNVHGDLAAPDWSWRWRTGLRAILIRNQRRMGFLLDIC